MHIHICWFYCSLLSLLCQLSFESSISKALFVPFIPSAEHQQLTKGPWLPSTAFSDGIYENPKLSSTTLSARRQMESLWGNQLPRPLNSFYLPQEPDKGVLSNLQKLGRISLGNLVLFVSSSFYSVSFLFLTRCQKRFLFHSFRLLNTNF